jgi:Flp pilus assembly pilin Flp
MTKLPTFRDDDGMATVEYAIATLAAAALAGVLYTVISGESVVAALAALIERALAVKF